MFNQSSISSRELEIVYKILTNRDFTLLANLKNITKKEEIILQSFEKLRAYELISNKELLYLSRTVETILEEWTIFINRCIKIF